MGPFLLYENMKCGIYITTNLINKKQYIGQSIHLDNPNYIGSGIILKKAIKKYGKLNFRRDVLQFCNKEDLNELEIYWIYKFKAVKSNSFYNRSFGGGRNVYKYKPVEQYDLDGNFIKEWDAVISVVRALNLNEISIRNCCNNKTLSSGGFQWKYKNANKSISKYNYTNLVKVEAYDLNGSYIKTFNSIIEAAKECGIKNKSSISNQIAGRIKSIKGYQFKIEGSDKKVEKYQERLYFNFSKKNLKNFDSSCKSKKRKSLNRKRVCIKDIFGNEIFVYENVDLAAEDFGISTRSIRQLCCKKFSLKGEKKLFFEYK